VSLLPWVVAFVLRTFGNVGDAVDRIIAMLAFLALSLAGAPVVHHRPDSSFGWIASGYGLLVGLEGIVIGYAIAATPAAGGAMVTPAHLPRARTALTMPTPPTSDECCSRGKCRSEQAY
jgi:hypothetical protein